ncbi:MAG: hypothetical protein ACI9F9_000659 [Candidatus Paceibacteria bacterium]|jgi:hypothetical protein
MEWRSLGTEECQGILFYEWGAGMIACSTKRACVPPSIAVAPRFPHHFIARMSPLPPSNEPNSAPRAISGWISAGLALLVASLVLWRTHGIGMMGFDSYPLILSARIENWADFLGTFNEELMDGRYAGHYFRPLLNLSFALDHWLWGLDPFGYQLSGAVLFGACGWALALLLGRMLGAGAGPSVLAGLAFFFLHDSHFEAIPVPARRPEMMCGLFACLALASQLDPRALTRKWSVAAPVLMLLAAASKETGYALPAVCVVAVYFYSPATSLRQRALHAVRVGLMHSLAVGALLLLRISTLGGLGGPAPLPTGLSSAPPIELSALLLQRLFVPQNVESWGLVVPLLAGLALATLALVWVLGRGAEDRTATAKPSSAMLVSCTWVALVVLLYGISRSIEQWYMFLPVLGLSMVVASAAELIRRSLASTVQRRRLIGGLAALSLVGFSYCQLRYTPLFHDYPEWSRATQASEEFLTKLETRIDGHAPGEAISAPPIPIRHPVAQEGPALRGVVILDAYSVQAWVELRYPERKFRVLKAPPETPLAKDESAIRLTRSYEF